MSRDVSFNESSFPLREHLNIQNPVESDEIDDNESPIPGTNVPTHTIDSDPPTPTPTPAPAPLSASTPAPPAPRPVRSTRPPSRYGNTVLYAAITRGTSDADNPTYS